MTGIMLDVVYGSKLVNNYCGVIMAYNIMQKDGSIVNQEPEVGNWYTGLRVEIVKECFVRCSVCWAG